MAAANFQTQPAGDLQPKSSLLQEADALAVTAGAESEVIKVIWGT